MNKSSIKKLMATSVLTTIIAMSNMQLVSAASSGCNVNLSKITTNCVKGKTNCAKDLSNCVKGQINGAKDQSNCTKGKTNCAKDQSSCGTKVEKTSNGNTDSKNTNNNTNATNNTNNTSNSGNTATKPNEAKPDSSVATLEKEVVTLVNAERAKAGLPALKANAELSNVARLKSQDMIDKKYFSHTSPTYGSPFDMMKKFGVKYSAAGENIASGYPTAKAVVDGWMNSPGHKANILSKSFTEIGVGLAKSSDGTYYWTQMFINPGK
ncbi:serine protease [Clostridium botulinum]|uniref:SCP-like extracellular protein n=1 Tax=Clostridium botulinum (strain Okra / Type B1) TaxID=498213 RepID=B1INA6_CLOBK|nr:CAP domain-containing protein [Clostridium botulinum]EKX78918.1 SCP-like extracellular protein [Clostridium botulinum CFSAN001628]ACA45808.1 SCP-like extracellular protein [Clostridium botulinum B1 str. Okra]MBD5564128.1 serine protease [Clostridium botulinum]MBD5566430.1 serine protease [Clostridium botulinum]MBD5569054.1 serine protease [Clostridium botulinum]